jgi:hypothetical protein
MRQSPPHPEKERAVSEDPVTAKERSRARWRASLDTYVAKHDQFLSLDFASAFLEALALSYKHRCQVPHRHVEDALCLVIDHFGPLTADQHETIARILARAAQAVDRCSCGHHASIKSGICLLCQKPFVADAPACLSCGKSFPSSRDRIVGPCLHCGTPR